MIAVPAIGAAVVAALPRGRDLLAKQVALGVSLVVLLLAVLADGRLRHRRRPLPADHVGRPGSPTSACSSRSASTASRW